MGRIEVQMSGSFGARNFSDSAEAGGHAAALSRIIESLVQALPEMIRKDHHLHAQGEQPPLAPFGEWQSITSGKGARSP